MVFFFSFNTCDTGSFLHTLSICYGGLNLKSLLCIKISFFIGLDHIDFGWRKKKVSYHMEYSAALFLFLFTFPWTIVFLDIFPKTTHQHFFQQKKNHQYFSLHACKHVGPTFIFLCPQYFSFKARLPLPKRKKKKSLLIY